MKLLLVKSAWLDDWYTIERAEHDGREWLERTGPNSMSLRCSSRICDADVEGDASEMLEIAKAIRARKPESFKRCAVSFRDDGVHIWSPRNSTGHGIATIAEADDLAAQIESTLNAPATEVPETGGDDDG